MVNINEFAAMDIRVAKILEVSDLPGARKPLYKVKVDLGPELGIREIAAGVKDFYTPEQLVGKNILMIVNLEPKSIAGFVSEGMLLAVDTESGISIIVPDSDAAKPGAKVR